MVETALRLRDMLKKEGLRSWPKLTGGKGLHVMVPVAPRLSHEEARTYCRAFAERVTRTAPDRYTPDPAPEQRVDRLYVDYLRNGRGNTAVAPTRPVCAPALRSRPP